MDDHGSEMGYRSFDNVRARYNREGTIPLSRSWSNDAQKRYGRFHVNSPVDCGASSQGTTSVDESPNSNGSNGQNLTANHRNVGSGSLPSQCDGSVHDHEGIYPEGQRCTGLLDSTSKRSNVKGLSFSHWVESRLKKGCNATLNLVQNLLDVIFNLLLRIKAELSQCLYHRKCNYIPFPPRLADGEPMGFLYRSSIRKPIALHDWLKTSYAW